MFLVSMFYAEIHQYSQILDFKPICIRKQQDNGEIMVKWSNLAQLGIELRAINVH